MTEHNPSKEKLHSGHTLVAMLGQQSRQQKLLEPFHKIIKIEQKTILHTPTQKLQDCMVTMLIGNTTIYETNTTLSAEPALWKAWGRDNCADQSTIHRTLDACTLKNVEQLHQVNALFLKSVGRSLRHDYTKGPLIIDGDITGLPCSKHYEGASPGYFADCPKGTSGRQLFRFSAADYNEIIHEQTFPGNTGSSNLANFMRVLEATFAVLGLEPNQKGQVLLRLDAGYGTADILNYLIKEGYQFVVKLYSSSRAIKLCSTVKKWLPDPKQPLRAAALLEVEPYEQDGEGEILQIGVRYRLKGKAKDKGEGQKR
jgi:hypothetical protein